MATGALQLRQPVQDLEGYLEEPSTCVGLREAVLDVEEGIRPTQLVAGLERHEQDGSSVPLPPDDRERPLDHALADQPWQFRIDRRPAFARCLSSVASKGVT